MPKFHTILTGLCACTHQIPYSHPNMYLCTHAYSSITIMPKSITTLIWVSWTPPHVASLLWPAQPEVHSIHRKYVNHMLQASQANVNLVRVGASRTPISKCNTLV